MVKSNATKLKIATVQYPLSHQEMLEFSLGNIKYMGGRLPFKLPEYNKSL